MRHNFPILRLALLFILILGFGACASEPVETESPAPEQAEPPAPVESPVFPQLTPSKAQEIMACDTPFVLLDVREPSEFETGYISGAVLMPLGTLRERASLEILDKDAQIIVYCRSGRRSVDAIHILLELGFQNVFNLGGILDWPYEITQAE